MIKSLFSTILVIILSLSVAGCSEKENKDLLEIRHTIVDRNYSMAKELLSSEVLGNSVDGELQTFSILLDLWKGNEWSNQASKWRSAISALYRNLQQLETEISAVGNLSDEKELDRFERLERKRNSISNFLANALHDLYDDSPKLLENLINLELINSLLIAQKSYLSLSEKSPETLIQKSIRSFAKSSEIKKLLTEILENSDDTMLRIFAVRHLGNLRNRNFLTIFEKILKEKNEPSALLYETIIAVEKNLSGEAIPALLSATRANSAQTRMHTAKMLGWMKTSEATIDLLRLCADLNPYAQRSARNALRQLGNKKALIELLNSDAKLVLPAQNNDFIEKYPYLANAYISTDELVKRRNNLKAIAVEMLGNLKVHSEIPRFIDLLRDENLSASAARALAMFGSKAVPSLKKAVKSSHRSEQFHRKAIELLSQIGDENLTEFFVDLLENSNDQHLQAIVAEKLGNLKAKSALRILTKSLSFDDRTAINSAKSIGKIGGADRETIQKLLDLALNKNLRETVRRSVLLTLKSLRETSIANSMMLLALSDETNPKLRKIAIATLGELQHRESIPMLRYLLSTRYDTPKNFHRHMRQKYETLPALTEQFNTFPIEWNSSYPKPIYHSWSELKPIPGMVRSEAARTLAKLKADNSIEILLIALRKDERAIVRESAARTIGSMGKGSTVSELVQILKNEPQGLVRSAIVMALGEIGGDEVIAPLLATLKNDDYETTRKEAVIALRNVDSEEVVVALVEHLKRGVGTFEENREVQSVLDQIIWSITAGGNDQTSEQLLLALNSKAATDQWIRWAIIHSLGSIGSKNSVSTLNRELKDRRYRIRKEAIIALGKCGSQKAIKPLEFIRDNLSESPAIRKIAGDTIKGL